MVRAILLATFASMALAAPSKSQLQSLSEATIASADCKLPKPGLSCAEVQYKDVIVIYGNKASKEQKDVVKASVAGSGGKLVKDWNDFGFSAFVPAPVAKLVQNHGESFGLNLYENACIEIPWCGEAPC